MKHFLFFLLLISGFAKSQDLNTDLLRAPASPASNLLGTSSSEINRPTDVSDVIVGIQNFSTSLFKEGSYSLEIAPYWIFPSEKTDKSIEQMQTNRKSIPQTLLISFAVLNTDSTSTTKPLNSIFTAIGFKFSILRGEMTVENKLTIKKIKSLLTSSANDSSKTYDEIKSGDELYKKLKDELKEMLNNGQTPEEKIRIQNSKEYKETEALLDAQEKELRKIFDTKVLENDEYVKNMTIVEELYDNFKIERTGWIWDIAGGTSVQFKDKLINKSGIYNAGIWSVFGYQSQKYGVPMLLTRYMYNPESEWMSIADFEKTGNFSTFDAGLKYEYSPKNSDFTASVEGIYRSFLSGSDIDPTWKFVFNFDYQLWANQHLTLSLGKDFDHQIIKDGNVIAALSFVAGIGNKRKFK